MTKLTNDHTVWLYRFVVIILIVALLLFLVLRYLSSEQQQLQRSWQAEWRTQEQELLTVLKQPNQDLVSSPVVESWLGRCATEERREYEAVLQRLGTGLTAADLEYLAENFDRCGTMAADQSLAQGVALEREVAKLEQWFEARTFFPGLDQAYYQTRLENWKRMTEYAVAIQTAQHELDTLQRRLVQVRQDGAAVEGELIQGLLGEVSVAREVLSAATVAHREGLRNLSL